MKFPSISPERSRAFQELLDSSVRAALVLTRSGMEVLVPFDWSDARANAELEASAKAGFRVCGLVGLQENGVHFSALPDDEAWAACIRACEEFAWLCERDAVQSKVSAWVN
jgi:hypothetical protein